MFPLQSRRLYGLVGTVRPDKPKKSGNKKRAEIFSDIFYDPEGTLAAPGVEGNIPAKFADFDVHMEDWDSNKEQIAPQTLTARKEEICRVYLNPCRPSAKKAGARALAEMSVDAIHPPPNSLPTIFSAGKPNKTRRGATDGKPPMLKTFTPGITAKITESGGGIFRVPAVPVKDLKAQVTTGAGSGAGANIDLQTKDKIVPEIQPPAAPIKTTAVTEANDTQADSNQDEEDNFKENEPPSHFLRGVDSNNDSGFGTESPFGSDLPHLNTPCLQESILANDPSSKLRVPISVDEAMDISSGNELGSVPLIREGALGELSAEHLYLTDPRGLVYIPSTGLQYRYDSSCHFVPTLTMESAIEDIKKNFKKPAVFEIFEDGSDDERKDRTKPDGVHGKGSQEIEEGKDFDDDDDDDPDDGDEDNEDDDDVLDKDEYEALLKLHFGDGWTEDSAENPPSGTILVRSQVSSGTTISYNNITESQDSVDDDTGSFPPPAKLRIVHRSPGTERGVSDPILPVNSAGNVEVAVQKSTFSEIANDENALPLRDACAFVCGDENETPPSLTSVPLHASCNENHLLAVPSNKISAEILPQGSPPLISKISPVTYPQSPSLASPAISPLTAHSPPNPEILSVTTTQSNNTTDSPSTQDFPASFTRLNSFRQSYRDPAVSLTKEQSQRRPTDLNDTDDDEPHGSLPSGIRCGTDEILAVNPECGDVVENLDLHFQVLTTAGNTTLKAEVESTSFSFPNGRNPLTEAQ